LVVVALGGVMDHRGADGLIERPVYAVHGIVDAPLRARNDVRRLARGDDGGRRAPLGVGWRLRRGNQNGRNVLFQRLFRGGRKIPQGGGGGGSWARGLRGDPRGGWPDL